MKTRRAGTMGGSVNNQPMGLDLTKIGKVCRRLSCKIASSWKMTSIGRRFWSARWIKIVRSSWDAGSVRAGTIHRTGLMTASVVSSLWPRRSEYAKGVTPMWSQLRGPLLPEGELQRSSRNRAAPRRAGLPSPSRRRLPCRGEYRLFDAALRGHEFHAVHDVGSECFGFR